MRVSVCGPNLRDQSKGEFHVHAEGCADLRNYGPGKRLGGEEPWALDVSDRLGVVGEVYDFVPVEEASAYLGEFHFAPCCAELPKEGGTVKEHEIAFGLTDYETSVLHGALIERGERWEADEETCKGLVTILLDQLGPEDGDGGWDVLKSGDARAGRVALIVNEQIVELTTGMYRALCGLVHPTDEIDAETVTASEEDWQALRALFPLSDAHTTDDES